MKRTLSMTLLALSLFFSLVACRARPGDPPAPSTNATPSSFPDGGPTPTGEAPSLHPSGPSFEVQEQQEYYDWLKDITEINEDVSDDVAEGAFLKFSGALSSNMDGFIGARERYYKAKLYHGEERILTLKLLVRGESGADDAFDSLVIDNSGGVKQGDSGKEPQ